MQFKSTMISIIQNYGHPRENERVCRKNRDYESPRVQSETEVQLESDLLAGSIMYSSWVEIAGQGMRGLYFEEGDIVTDDNYWGE